MRRYLYKSITRLLITFPLLINELNSSTILFQNNAKQFSSFGFYIIIALI